MRAALMSTCPISLIHRVCRYEYLGLNSTATRAAVIDFIMTRSSKGRLRNSGLPLAYSLADIDIGRGSALDVLTTCWNFWLWAVMGFGHI